MVSSRSPSSDLHGVEAGRERGITDSAKEAAHLKDVGDVRVSDGCTGVAARPSTPPIRPRSFIVPSV